MKYYKKRLAHIPFITGITQGDGSRSSTGEGGYICYGPYISLDGGAYFGGFNVRKLEPTHETAAMTIDAACRGGNEMLGARVIAPEEILSELPGLLGLEFQLAEPCQDFELRLHVAPGVKVNVTEIVLFHL